MSTRGKRLLGISGALVILLVSAASLLATTFRQTITDYVSAAQYSPTDEMLRVLSQVAPRDEAEIVFKATHPTLDAAESFNTSCSDVTHSENSQVVGCYTGDRIHLFRITDPRLRGMVEVTAAHELLHAMYDRMSVREKRSLRTQLMAEYKRLSAADPGLTERMSVYEDLNEDAFANELHSVLGTEIEHLSQPLEQHYAKIFSNRASITALFAGYNARFEELDAEREDLSATLELLRPEIEARSAVYQDAVAQFNTEAQALTNRNNSLAFSSDPAEFYRLRNMLTAEQQRLEAERISLNELIESYNAKRSRLIELNAITAELYQSFDSTPAVTVPAEN